MAAMGMTLRRCAAGMRRLPVFFGSNALAVLSGYRGNITARMHLSHSDQEASAWSADGRETLGLVVHSTSPLTNAGWQIHQLQQFVSIQQKPNLKKRLVFTVRNISCEKT